MSTNAHNIIKNFNYQIESITPTNQKKKNSFRHYNPYASDPSKSAFRRFFVQWHGSDPDYAATDLDHREAPHQLRLHVDYPTTIDSDDLEEMILQDRHDLIKKLRDSTSYVGISKDNTTAATGLMRRLRIGDATEREQFPGVVRLMIDWECKIEESEQ